jgi:hypothetical protein
MAANLDEICTLVVEVAREAGGIIRNARPTAQTTASKKNSKPAVFTKTPRPCPADA